MINIMLAISALSLVAWIGWACHENKKLNQDKPENEKETKRFSEKLASHLFNGYE